MLLPVTTLGLMAHVAEVPNGPAQDPYTWGYTDKATCDGKSAAYDCSPTKIGAYYYRDQWGYDLRNCTSYVAWRVAVEFGANASDLGHAVTWDNNAPSKQWTVKPSSSPEIGDIAQWDSGAGGLGHVAFVERVNLDGSVYVVEYNRGLDGKFGSRDNVRAERYIDVNGANPAGFTLKLSNTPSSSTPPPSNTPPTPSPTLIQRPSGETDIIAVGSDNSLDFYVNTPGAPNWGKIDIPNSDTDSTPVVVQRPSGETDIVARGLDGSLDMYINAQGSPNWGKIEIAGPGSAFSAPAVIQRPSGETNIAVPGRNNTLMFYWNAQGSSAWGRSLVAVGGYSLRSPAMVQRPTTGETDMVIVGPDERLDFYVNELGSPYWGVLAVAGVGAVA